MNPLNNSTDKSPSNSRTLREELTIIQMELKSSAEQIYSSLLVEYPLFFEYFQSFSNLEVFCAVLGLNMFYFRSRIFYLILQVWFYYVIYNDRTQLYLFLVPQWQFYGFYLTVNHIFWDREINGVQYNKILYDHLVKKHYLGFLKEWRYVDKYGKERHPPMITINLTLFIFLKKYIYEGTFLYGLARDILWLLDLIFFGGVIKNDFFLIKRAFYA